MTRNLALLALALGLTAPLAQASVTLLDKDSWKIMMRGFAALDVIVDTTRGLPDVAGSFPVARPTVTAGMTGETQFSIRNTRLAFEVEAPESAGWRTRSVFEFDLAGFNPDPSTNSNTELAFMTSPTFRARQLYLEATHDEWRLVAGQTWSLFGWQPYYFSSTGDASPLAGAISSRTAQLAAVHTGKLGDGVVMQIGAAASRPPQRDAQIPAADGGVRFELGQRRAGFASGVAGPRGLQPLSIGLSGTGRYIVLPRSGGQVGQVSYFGGGAGALDAFIPVIAADEGATDPEHTLSLVLEGTVGRGYGDHFLGWTGNLAPNPAGANLDAGLGGQDSQGNFRLIEMRSYQVRAQYHLNAAARTWLETGYGQVYSTNAGLFVSTNGLSTYTRAEAFSLAGFHDFTSQLRLGLTYAYLTTGYFNGETNHDHRVQLSLWFVF